MVLQFAFVALGVITLLIGLVYILIDGYVTHRNFLIEDGDLYWIGGDGGNY